MDVKIVISTKIGLDRQVRLVPQARPGATGPICPRGPTGPTGPIGPTGLSPTVCRSNRSDGAYRRSWPDRRYRSDRSYRSHRADRPHRNWHYGSNRASQALPVRRENPGAYGIDRINRSCRPLPVRRDLRVRQVLRVRGARAALPVLQAPKALPVLQAARVLRDRRPE